MIAKQKAKDSGSYSIDFPMVLYALFSLTLNNCKLFSNLYMQINNSTNTEAVWKIRATARNFQFIITSTDPHVVYFLYTQYFIFCYFQYFLPVTWTRWYMTAFLFIAFSANANVFVITSHFISYQNSKIAKEKFRRAHCSFVSAELWERGRICWSAD